MPAIHSAIKRRRRELKITQQEMSEKLHLSLKAWQNIENGDTKLDIERLTEIAKVLDTTVMDLIDQPEGIYIEQMTNESSQIGFSVKEVTINRDVSKELLASERAATSRMLADKDALIAELRNEVKTLKGQYQELIQKLAAKLL